jgi:hypothetical protein
MKVLLVEPDYYSRYPPLGLLKIGKMEERGWNDVRLVRGTQDTEGFEPQKVMVTSLFTFAWEPVHNAIAHYHEVFPDAEIVVGGIYATLMPEHIKNAFPYVRIHSGLIPEAEGVLPAYHLLRQVDKWKDWKKSIVFTTRGCIRKCPFCVVPKIEGKMREPKFSILPLIHPSHNEVVIWDNNFLASPYAKDILVELRDGGYRADFNQGLDARLMTEEFAGLLADIKSPSIHMAYDWTWEGPDVHRAINLLTSAGYRGRDMIFYVLHNFYDFKYNKGDTPADFFHRIRDLAEWGASSYPMRFIPLDSLTRNGFVSPLWTAEELEMIADARRVMGHMGTFVPYGAFVNKILSASNFEEAMKLRERIRVREGPRADAEGAAQTAME